MSPLDGAPAYTRTPVSHLNNGQYEDRTILLPKAYAVTWHTSFPNPGATLISRTFRDLDSARAVANSLKRHVPGSSPVLTPVYSRKGYDDRH